MLKSLRLENLTVFTDATFEFGRNLNIIVGENGAGKSHVLKAAYTALMVSSRASKDQLASRGPKSYLQRAIADKIIRVFRPNELGRLSRRTHGNLRCKVTCLFDSSDLNISFSFHTRSKSEVTIDDVPSAWVDSSPVFFPTRELLSIYPNFVSIYENTDIAFEETWRDTCILLGAPLAKGPREKRIKELLVPLEEAMEGSIVLDPAGRFYLSSKAGIMEIHLVAEGRRKLAMVARLIATGSLLDKGCLFWDEPEANLNPKMVRLIAKTIMELSRNGIQIFVATHSLFLMRELQILLMQQSYAELDSKCFGLHREDNAVHVVQGPTIDDIGDITSLDEELMQSERYLEAEVI
jgi:predicted ATPase